MLKLLNELSSAGKLNYEVHLTRHHFGSYDLVLVSRKRTAFVLHGANKARRRRSRE